MNFGQLFALTELGLQAFEKIFLGQLSEQELDLGNKNLVAPIAGTGGFTVKKFSTAKEMAQSVLASLRPRSAFDELGNIGMWAWLTYVMRDVLFESDANGRRLVREIPRWFPSAPSDWQKGQRHLVRMPVLLLESFGDDADHLLCGSPSTLPEIREQLTSQQDMFNGTFQRVARALYFDERRSSLKRGAGGKAGGTPRRLAKVRRQLDVTWELDELEFDRIVATLPSEFDRFKPEEYAKAAT